MPIEVELHIEYDLNMNILSMSHGQSVVRAVLGKHYSKILVSETNGSICSCFLLISGSLPKNRP